MEDDEEQLRDESGRDEAEGDVDGKRENAVPQAEPPVEAQTGHAAGVEGGGVDDVRGEVEDFGHVNDGEGKYVFDVFDVPAGAEGEEFEAEADEGDELCLFVG